MVPAVTEGGRSFKGAAFYYLHDKRLKGEAERLTADRVAWTHTVNLPTDDPQRAWRMMADTAMSQAALKKAAGEKATGRKLTKPVYAYSLAWHPEQRVSKDLMLSTALDSIRAQQLEGYQAIIVAHDDEPQQHVHVVINRVHPETGKAATLSNNTLKLSQWAEAYEKQHGKIYCDRRVENNRKREQGEFVKEPRIPRPEYERRKAVGNDSLSMEFIKSNEKQKDAQLYELGRQIDTSHGRQWDEQKRVYEAARKQITDHGRRLKDNRTAEIKDAYKEKWRLLFRKQKMENWAHGQREASFLSRLFNGLSLLDEIKQNHQGTLMILFALMTRKGHLDALAVRHEAERRELAGEVRDAIRTASKAIDRQLDGDYDRLRKTHLKQCGQLRETQGKQKAEQKERWTVRNAERKAALAPYRIRRRDTTRSRDVGRSRSMDSHTPQGGRRGPGMRPANAPKPD